MATATRIPFNVPQPVTEEVTVLQLPERSLPPVFGHREYGTMCVATLELGIDLARGVRQLDAILTRKGY